MLGLLSPPPFWSRGLPQWRFAALASVIFCLSGPEAFAIEAGGCREILTDPSPTGVEYSGQNRGGIEEYRSYFAGMNKTTQQKLGLTTAGLPTVGVVADMGSGSGEGTYHLAAVYPELHVVGVDINTTSVALSRESYRKPNLSYREGDIAAPLFPADSLDGILDSSVFHHVTSFNQFDLGKVFSALDHQVGALKTRGTIIIRDFVIPQGPSQVLLDLPTSDGSPVGAPATLSTSALFERFAQTFKSSVYPDGQIKYSKLPSPRQGFSRYALDMRTANEFILRMDYRQDWDVELLEEYTYLSQAGFERALTNLGLRVVLSKEIYNPWITKNRFRGKFYWSDTSGRVLPLPPSNYLIVGEKVPLSIGTRLEESSSHKTDSPQFTQIHYYKTNASKKIWELIERPGQTLDVIPWYQKDGKIYIVVRQAYPRPVINSRATRSLTRTQMAGYLTEPLTAIQREPKSLLTAATEVIEANSGPLDQSFSVHSQLAYFTSPGGLDEKVSSVLVQLSSPFIRKKNLRDVGFSDSGTIQSIDADRAFHAFQVGGLFDVRLEVNLYHLFRTLNRPPLPWIGTEVHLRDQIAEPFQAPSRFSELPPAKTKDLFHPISVLSLQFLEVRSALFVETNANGSTLHTVPLEYVVPKDLSPNSISILPVVRRGQDIYIGLEERDLPSVQRHNGSPRIMVAPAWRLPRTIKNLSQAQAFVRKAIQRDFQVNIGAIEPLGGEYFPTPGITPEIVYPHLAEIDLSKKPATTGPLCWYNLKDIFAQIDRIEDAHTLSLVNRLSHALGFMNQSGP